MERFNLLNKSWKCECGHVHAVPVKRVLIEAGAVGKIAEVMHALGIGAHVFLLADETTYEVAGRVAEKTLLAGGYNVHTHVLRGRPYADDATAGAVASLVPPSCDAIISCGSGTITDLGKWAAFKCALPQIAIATAPSMNGYASGIVALTEGGLKTTRAVRPPLAVIADVDILAASPLEMIHAGLGDVLSKSVCNADWRLASIIKGEHFCPKPVEIIKDLEELYVRDAHLIPKRDPKIIQALTEALIFSGISMVIAGSSAPASGAEHLISHFIDMRALATGRGHDLHGAQVGVASIATARLYEKIMALSAQDIDATALASAHVRAIEARERCKRIFGHIGDAIDAEAKKKWGSEKDTNSELIATRWDEIKAAVSPILTSSRRICSALASSGAKVHYSDLGLSADEFGDALRLAMFIRSRYTVLDLVFALGELDKWVEEVIQGGLSELRHDFLRHR